MSSEKKNIYKALAAFQQECPVIHETTEGYMYSYAPFSRVVDAIKPFLKKNGLAFTQLVEGTGLTTILIHPDSGETIQSHSDIPQGVKLKGMNDFQVVGSAITYFKRYALSAMLGIIADSDTDGYGKQEEPKDPIGWARANAKVSAACKAMGLNEAGVKDAVESGDYNEKKVLGYLNELADAIKDNKE